MKNNYKTLKPLAKEIYKNILEQEPTFDFENNSIVEMLTKEQVQNVEYLAMNIKPTKQELEFNDTKIKDVDAEIKISIMYDRIENEIDKLAGV